MICPLLLCFVVAFSLLGIVIPVVVGSNPISHPINSSDCGSLADDRLFPPKARAKKEERIELNAPWIAARNAAGLTARRATRIDPLIALAE
jgi:hypothetical protein